MTLRYDKFFIYSISYYIMCGPNLNFAQDPDFRPY